MTRDAPTALLHFRDAYAEHRAAEGRRYSVADMFALPYLRSGRLAKQWSVRARTFDAFVQRVLIPATRHRHQPLRLLDLGAGNGWLCWRATQLGIEAVAIDIRDDDVDGLGAAAPYLQREPIRFGRVVASFDALPFRKGRFDIVVFNAALHYACDLRVVLEEAWRSAAPGGRIVVLDSPFYERDADGASMVAEKRRDARRQFGERAALLTALPAVEYLTRERLHDASRTLGLEWRHYRVRYPLWYRARPLVAWLRRRRPPSRFDLWECTVR
jgi:SAM-dependent methyltransferase